MKLAGLILVLAVVAPAALVAGEHDVDYLRTDDLSKEDYADVLAQLDDDLRKEDDALEAQYFGSPATEMLETGTQSGDPDDLNNNNGDSAVNQMSADPDDADNAKDSASAPMDATVSASRHMSAEDLAEASNFLGTSSKKISESAWSAIWEKRQKAASGAAPAAKPAPEEFTMAVKPVVDSSSTAATPLTAIDAALKAQSMKPRSAPTVDNLLPLLRFYDAETKDTYTTVDPNDELVKSSPKWTFQGVVSFLYATPVDRASKMYLCYDKAAKDHFYALDSACNGAVSKGISGFVHKERDVMLVALNEFYNSEVKDHLYSVTPATHLFINGNGYQFTKVMGYVHALRAPNDTVTYGGRVGGILDKAPAGATKEGTVHPATPGLKEGIPVHEQKEVAAEYEAKKEAEEKAQLASEDAAAAGSGEKINSESFWKQTGSGSEGSAAATAAAAAAATPVAKPAEEETKEEADGSKVTTQKHDDGTVVKVVKKPDGTVSTITVHPDGQTSTAPGAPAGFNTETMGHDEDLAEEHAKLPKSQPAQEKVEADGTKVVTQEHADGTTTVVTHAPDGKKVTKVIKPNGEEEEHEGDTSAHVAHHAAKKAAAATGAKPGDADYNPNTESKGTTADHSFFGNNAPTPNTNANTGASTTTTTTTTTNGEATSPDHESPSASTGSTSGNVEEPETTSSSSTPKAPAPLTGQHPSDPDLVPVFRYYSKAMSDHYYTTNFEQLGNGKNGWEYQGVQMYVHHSQKDGTTPLYRYFSVRTGDHYYTTSYDEMKSGANGYRYKGVLGYVWDKKHEGTVPVFQYFNEDEGDHFLTTNFEFLQHGGSGWVYQKIACYAFPHPGAGVDENTAAVEMAAATGQVSQPMLVPLFRYWNSNLHDHFYTTLWKEVEVGSHGWEYQGVAALVYNEVAPGTVPMYRFWNIETLDHFYTTNRTSVATGNDDGWVFEGVQCHVANFRADGTVPLFGYYNADYHDHFYATAKLGEDNHGWKLEGIQAYVWTTPLSKCANPPKVVSIANGVPAAPGAEEHEANKVEDPLQGAGKASAAVDPVTRSADTTPPATAGTGAASGCTATSGSLVAAAPAGPAKVVAVDAKDIAGVKGGYVHDPLEGTPRKAKELIPVVGTEDTGLTQTSAGPDSAPQLKVENDKMPRDPLAMGLLQIFSGESTDDSPDGLGHAQAMLAAKSSELTQPATAAAKTTDSPTGAITGEKANVVASSSTPDLAVENPTHADKNFLAPPNNKGDFKPKVVLPDRNALTPMYRYWHGIHKDHFYTTKTFTLEGWEFQGLQAYIFKHHQPNSVPLFRYFNKRIYDHFYSTKYRKGGDAGYEYQGIVGFVMEKKMEGMLPLFQYMNSVVGDHFYTTSWKHLGQGKHGWQFEGTQGYVYPPQPLGGVADASPDAWKGGFTPVPLYAYHSALNADHFYSTSNQWGEKYDAQGKLISSSLDKAGANAPRGVRGMKTQGVVGLVYLHQAPKTVALHRYYNSRVRDHFYTTNWMTLQKGGKNGWVYEGIQAYVFHTHEDGTVPVYRYYARRTHDHIYTTNFQGQTLDNGAKLQGISFYVKQFMGPAAQEPEWLRAIPRTALYRYYNRKTNDHFYTTKSELLGRGRNGWTYQGIAGYAPQASQETVPLYVYFNTYSSDHFYTRNQAILGKGGKYGWKYQGVECQVFKKQMLGTVALHRYYNTRVKDHYYTTNIKVLGNGGRDGWKYQGIEGYIFPAKTE